jgi:diaminohydroxyphosphoribosylaminopyrimidine deaminase/5-amino-6-(5-phosphoribosylamino)uracil reductase
MTLDGRIATRRGHSRWISSPEARAWAHRELRATVDAILVGAGTVRADDPALTNRSRRGKDPLRVVVCGRRPLPRGAKVLRGPQATLLAAPRGFPAPRGGAEVLRCGRSGRVDLGRLLRALHDRGIGRLLVEGGGGILGALFDKGLVDQVCVFLAERILGGRGAPGPVGGRGRALALEALGLDHAVRRAVGRDLVVEGYVRR